MKRAAASSAAAKAEAQPKAKVVKRTATKQAKQLSKWKRKSLQAGVSKQLKEFGDKSEMARAVVTCLQKLEATMPGALQEVWDRCGAELSSAAAPTEHGKLAAFLDAAYNSPGFAAPNPSTGVKAVRDHLDRLVREHIPKQEVGTHVVKSPMFI